MNYSYDTNELRNLNTYEANTKPRRHLSLVRESLFASLLSLSDSVRIMLKKNVGKFGFIDNYYRYYFDYFNDR